MRHIAKMSAHVTPAPHSLGDMNVACPHCSAWMWINERISQSSLRNPKFQLCCDQGRYTLPSLKPTPTEIRLLLRNADDRAKDFRKYIRGYNSAMSFTSLGVNLDQAVANSNHGAFNFRIQGGIYHRIGSLLPNDTNNRPAFSQIYVHDPEIDFEIELGHRRAIGDHLQEVTLRELQQLMHRINPFASDLKNAAQTFRQENQPRDLQIIIQAEGTPDPRRYNRPTTNELAILIIDRVDNEETPSVRDVVLRSHCDELQTISEMNQYYDPLHYVLIFPHGMHLAYVLKILQSSKKSHHIIS